MMFIRTFVDRDGSVTAFSRSCCTWLYPKISVASAAGLAISGSSTEVRMAIRGLTKSSLFFSGLCVTRAAFNASQTAARACGLSVRPSTSSTISRAAGFSSASSRPAASIWFR
jgi:hypothetical protein